MALAIKILLYTAGSVIGLILLIIAVFIVLGIVNAVMPKKYSIMKITSNTGVVTYEVIHYYIRIMADTVKYDKEVVSYIKSSVSDSNILNGIKSSGGSVEYAVFSSELCASIYVAYLKRYNSNGKSEEVKSLSEKDLERIINVLEVHS